MESGMDLLRKKLEAKGATKAQIESNAVKWMLEIFAEAEHPDLLKILTESIAAANVAGNAANKERAKLIEERDKYIRLNKNVENLLRAAEEAKKEADQEREALAACETPEARDRRRLAIFYKKTIQEICGCLDDYATARFVSGLGIILSGSKYPNVNGSNEIEGIEALIPEKKPYQQKHAGRRL